MVGNKWSTIAAQLPGRTDNEIKNYWNTHLKKRLIRMGINPETYAPPSSSSSSPPPPAASDGGDGGTPPSSSVTRHLAQWESARLEAEARHSRESLLFSGASSAAAAAVPTSSAHSAPADSTTDADFFLRMWNSEVGEAFRSKEATSATGTSLDSSSTKCSSSALTVAITKGGEGKRGAAAAGGGGSSVSSGDGERKDDVVDCAKSSVSGCRGGGGVNDEAMGRDGAGADSSSSNEMEEGYTSEETYQMYLNLVGDDMAVGHLFSLFGTDANEEAALDIAFK